MGRPAGIWLRSSDKQWCMTEGGRKVPLGFDKDAAQLEFHRRKAEGKKRRSAEVTLADLADCYREFMEREREPRTVEISTFYLRSFLKHAGRDTAASQVTPGDISAWLASRPTWGATTRCNGVTVVKRLYNWGKTQGIISTNPIKDVEKPRAGKREEFITPAEANIILDATRSVATRDLLVALRETGCRPIEVYTLAADRVDIAGGTWRVLNKTRHATGETYRVVYLSLTAIELSRRLLDKRPDGLLFLNVHGRPWTRITINKIFVRIRKRTGLGNKATAYAFRHLYITDALERGIPPATVAELVGHKNLNMIMRVYSKLKHRTDHLREAAQMIRPAS